MPQTDCGIKLPDIFRQPAPPCESAFDQCQYPATFMVWCSHHMLGCDYSGYRCDIHKNMLALDWHRQLDAMRMGLILRCLNCNTALRGQELDDHFRWIPL